MPELPEVETVKESLKLRLVGKTIKHVNIYHNNIIEYPLVDEFKMQIINQRVCDIDRYGKWLIFILDDYFLLSHLRMEGKYFFKLKTEDRNKHEHVIFTLDDDTELRYMDVRKFGKMHLIKKEDIKSFGPLITMGLEPWDEKLNVSYLRNCYSKKRLPIKTVLLDQSIIVGIGNIYADEILFLSNINPLVLSKDLTDNNLEDIINNTKVVLENAISKGGTTIRSYTSVDGVHGLFQQELYVHNQVNKPCKKCGEGILKIKVGGRGTYYCPKCQKLD